jgi:putative GTP pyrophosphokinase
MQTKSELFLKYQFTKKMLETEIEILINEFVFKHGYNPVEHIKSRVKTEDSIKNKLEKKGYSFTTDNIVKHIHDAVGFRIVVSFLSDVYDIVSMIKKSNNLIILEQKDYIKDPKDTGYTSYHLNVLVPLYLDDKVEYVEAEIQIRTMAMDFWASLDHKIQYKFPENIPEEVKEKMYENSLIIKELDKRMMRLNEAVNKYDNKEN